MSFTPQQQQLFDQARGILDQKESSLTPQQQQLINQGRSIIQKQTPKQAPKQDLLTTLGNIGSEFAKFPERLSETTTQDFLDLLTSKEQTPLEEGLALALRDVGSSVFGLPGDILNFFRTLPGTVLDPIAESFGIQKPEAPSKILPTKEDLQSFVDNLYEGDLKNISPEVDLTKNITEDLAFLMTPLGVQKGFGLLKNLGLSVFSNLVAEGAVDADLIDQSNKGLIKFGTTFFTSMIRPKQLMKTGSKYLNQAEKQLKDVIITDPTISNPLKKALTSISESGGVEINPRAVKFTESILSGVEQGSFEANKITKAVRNLNKLIRKVGVNSDEAKALGKTRDALQKMAESIGQYNPKFIQSWNEGNQLFAAANTRNRVAQWVHDKIPVENLKNSPVELLSLLGLKFSGGKFLPIAIPANMAANAVIRLQRFPAVQRLYKQFLKESLSGSTKQAFSTFNKLSKQFEKSDDDLLSEEILNGPILADPNEL